GLGQSAAPGSLNANLTQVQVASIVGLDNLRKLREADGERRKSEHRGSWVASNFHRWRRAIEHYVSSVSPGNQASLNTARVPFASYLNGMHNRIHPIFADGFLESLDSLPPSHPMNDQHLVTRLEIVLTKEGHLRRMGIVKTSGLTAFDIAALDAIDRAQPFGPAPSAIISPDGNVYLHWEFHRDEVFACSTQGASPFILNSPPPTKEETQPPALPPAGPEREAGGPPRRKTTRRRPRKSTSDRRRHRACRGPRRLSRRPGGCFELPRSRQAWPVSSGSSSRSTGRRARSPCSSCSCCSRWASGERSSCCEPTPSRSPRARRSSSAGPSSWRCRRTGSATGSRPSSRASSRSARWSRRSPRRTRPQARHTRGSRRRCSSCSPSRPSHG